MLSLVSYNILYLSISEGYHAQGRPCLAYHFVLPLRVIGNVKVNHSVFMKRGNQIPSLSARSSVECKVATLTPLNVKIEVSGGKVFRYVAVGCFIECQFHSYSVAVSIVQPSGTPLGPTTSQVAAAFLTKVPVGETPDNQLSV